ncbi:MAG: efflux RND transporter permease subunit [Myxococcota bacterium]
MSELLIAWSLRNRWLVLVGALLIVITGTFNLRQMPVDVFPDLTAPSVTVITEAPGMAPEELETLVTFPIESALNGATDVRRIRSSTAAGIVVVWVEFEWGTDVFRARQLVAEKLALVSGGLPPEAQAPVLAPISSIMGEVLFVGVRGKEFSPQVLREASENLIRRRLLAVPGVAQVVPIGGEERQFQVLLDPARLQAYRLSVQEVLQAAQESSRNASAGFLEQGGTEYLLRGIGRADSLEALKRTVVSLRRGAAGQLVPVMLGDVAEVQLGSAFRRGDGGMQGEPAVVLGIQKQPGANTLVLTAQLDAVLRDIQTTLPEGMLIDRSGFRQADFIERAIKNVSMALRDGALLVTVILFIFLGSWRTTFVALTALPVSILLTALLLALTGDSLNTMSIGGITIAIGALVDDAIIDVENVLRRLREERLKPVERRRPVLRVIYEASTEVRGAIFFGTLVVVLVFVPLFFLSGVEGRLLRPLGLSYMVSILASFLVALSLTPVLSYWLLGRSEAEHLRPESRLVLGLKRLYAPMLELALVRRGGVLLMAGLLAATSLAVWPLLGRSFLPEFNEGSLTIGLVTLPGTTLTFSSELGKAAERALLEMPEVVSTTRRTGRAELDEHAQSVSASELDVVLQSSSRAREEVLADVRARLASIPGVQSTVGGPIAHRIDHMLSGTRAQVAVKLFGPDLERLRMLGTQAEALARSVPGLVDISLEQQTSVPQVRMRFDREALALHAITPQALADAVEVLFQGKILGRLVEKGRSYDLVARFPDHHRQSVEALREAPIFTPQGVVPLKALAEVQLDRGPGTINRENGQRKLVLSANVSGGDLRSAVDALEVTLKKGLVLPTGYYLEYGGQFESEAEASRIMGLLSLAVGLLMFLILMTAFGSARVAAVILVNLPLALMGGVAAVFLTGGIISIASLVGFVTLFGIATRNGIMMVSHYQHLERMEGASRAEAVRRGSMERLLPVLMTALTAGLALIPLVLNADAPGNELQAPLAAVVLGGLLTSTALNMLVIPPLYEWVAGALPPSKHEDPLTARPQLVPLTPVLPE